MRRNVRRGCSGGADRAAAAGVRRGCGQCGGWRTFLPRAVAGVDGDFDDDDFAAADLLRARGSAFASAESASARWCVSCGNGGTVTGSPSEIAPSRFLGCALAFILGLR